MEGSHLISVLRTFSKKEVRECRKWLASPSHNTRNDVIDLFEYLVTNNHLDDEKFLGKDRVFKKIFPGEEFDDARFRQSMHFLTKALEEFLAYQELKEDEVAIQLALARVYRKRKLDRAFQKAMRETENLYEEAPYQDAHFLRNKYLIQQVQYEYQSEKKRTSQLNLQEVSDALDESYFSEKLRQSCFQLSHQAVYKAGYQIGLIEEVLKYIEEKGLQRIPAIGIYYYILKAHSDKSNPVHFQKLKEQIEKHSHSFPLYNLRDIYILAINYCMGQVNLGDKTYLRELFELYKRGIETMALIDNGLISQYTFKNVVTAGTSLKEFDWVKSFIENYQQFLDPAQRENFVHFTLAKLHFEKGDFDKAHRLLVHFDYDDILTNLHAKSMLIRMYYQEGELDALESLLESMRSYVARKKVIGYHKSIYSNLIRYTRRLVRVNPYDPKQITKLRNEIEMAQPLTERQWLLEQLEAL